MNTGKMTKMLGSTRMHRVIEVTVVKYVFLKCNSYHIGWISTRHICR